MKISETNINKLKYYLKSGLITQDEYDEVVNDNIKRSFEPTHDSDKMDQQHDDIVKIIDPEYQPPSKKKILKFKKETYEIPEEGRIITVKEEPHKNKRTIVEEKKPVNESEIEEITDKYGEIAPVFATPDVVEYMDVQPPYSEENKRYDQRKESEFQKINRRLDELNEVPRKEIPEHPVEPENKYKTDISEKTFNTIENLLGSRARNTAEELSTVPSEVKASLVGQPDEDWAINNTSKTFRALYATKNINEGKLQLLIDKFGPDRVKMIKGDPYVLGEDNVFHRFGSGAAGLATSIAPMIGSGVGLLSKGNPAIASAIGAGVGQAINELIGAALPGEQSLGKAAINVGKTAASDLAVSGVQKLLEKPAEALVSLGSGYFRKKFVKEPLEKELKLSKQLSPETRNLSTTLYQRTGSPIAGTIEDTARQSPITRELFTESDATLQKEIKKKIRNIAERYKPNIQMGENIGKHFQGVIRTLSSQRDKAYEDALLHLHEKGAKTGIELPSFFDDVVKLVKLNEHPTTGEVNDASINAVVDLLHEGNGVLTPRSIAYLMKNLNSIIKDGINPFTQKQGQQQVVDKAIAQRLKASLYDSINNLDTRSLSKIQKSSIDKFKKMQKAYRIKSEEINSLRHQVLGKFEDSPEKIFENIKNMPVGEFKDLWKSIDDPILLDDIHKNLIGAALDKAIKANDNKLIYKDFIGALPNFEKLDIIYGSKYYKPALDLIKDISLLAERQPKYLQEGQRILMQDATSGNFLISVNPLSAARGLRSFLLTPAEMAELSLRKDTREALRVYVNHEKGQFEHILGEGGRALKKASRATRAALRGSGKSIMTLGKAATILSAAIPSASEVIMEGSLKKTEPNENNTQYEIIDEEPNIQYEVKQ